MARPKGAKSRKAIAQEAHISALAKVLAPSALKALEEIAVRGTSEAARVSAATAILDRAYGRPPQAITGDDGGPIKHVFGWLPAQN